MSNLARKRGGKRKIPILSQDRMPMQEFGQRPIIINAIPTMIPEPRPSLPPQEDEHSDDELMDDENIDWEQREDSIRQRMAESRERMKDLMENMDEEQLRRYETFRRSGIQRPLIKKWIQTYLGHQVHPNIAIIAAGIIKVYVGELVENALQAQEERKDSGPLMPTHIREAYRKFDTGLGAVSPATFVLNYIKNRL